jgi:hypothetical protein
MLGSVDLLVLLGYTVVNVVAVDRTSGTALMEVNGWK